MVDESLVAYLGDTPAVRALFADDFRYDGARAAEYARIAEKLMRVRILDPACGSGAFPMGLLNRMTDILGRLRAGGDAYSLKLAVIENCIYGCDIQCIAAQITKLRFFISLVCDCEKDASKPNFGIPTLPNLETKFAAANSLLAKKRKTEGDVVGCLFENPEIERAKRELASVRHEHFSAKTAHRKSVLRERDRQLRERLAALLADADNFAPEDARQLAAWNPYDQNAVAGFFDPEWMFGVKDGFDIVIGNPPYIQLQNNGGGLARLYAPCGYKTFARTGDIYCLFYERGHRLLKEGGHLCFITSNKWMRAGYGEKTRDFFAARTDPRLLVDFAGVKVFESATVDTNILLFAKAANRHDTLCAVTGKHDKDCCRDLGVFVRQAGTRCAFTGSAPWVVLSPVEQSIKRKIEAAGTPLRDWDIQINYGIKTGYNDAFIIDTAKREEILSKCADAAERERTEGLIRPILRGRDIKRYGYTWAGLWLINTHNGIKGSLERVRIDDYPAVKAHLDQYWDKISTRSDKGDTPYNLRNCAYLRDFTRQKLVFAEIARTGNAFALDLGNYFVGNTGYVLTLSGDCDEDKLLYLLAFLNSRVSLYCLDKLCTRFDDNGWRWLRQFVEQLCIPPFTRMEEIVPLLRPCLTGGKPADLEEVNRAVAVVYGLTEEETAYIDSLLGKY